MRALLLIVLVLVIFQPLEDRTALAGDPVRCTTRDDAQFKRLITECTDGSRAVSH